jgi:hypothetical protein
MNSIHFGNKKSFEINNSIQKNEIINTIENTMSVDIENRRYHFLEKNRMNELKNWDFLFTYNSFGAKVFIYLTQKNRKNTVYFIVRKTKKIVLSRLCFDDSLYHGTILEGEMVQINNKWIILISDIVAENGTCILGKPFSERYTTLKEILSKKYRSDCDLEPAQLLLKDYFTGAELNSFEKTYQPSLPFRINGLLFKCMDPKNYDILYIFPDNRNVNTNTHANMNTNANKSPTSINHIENVDTNQKQIYTKSNLNIEKRDCVFKMVITDLADVYELYSLSGQKYILHHHACVPNLSSSSKIQEWIEDDPKSLIVLCKFNIKFKKWEPMEITDKKPDYKNIVEDIEKLYLEN